MYGSYNYPTYNQNQPQLMTPRPNLSGRIVNSESDISYGEVPMDGSVAIFPKQDFSEIYARQMNNLGQVVMLTFKPVQTQQNSVPDLQSISDRLDKLEKSVYAKQNRGKEQRNEQSNV